MVDLNNFLKPSGPYIKVETNEYIEYEGDLYQGDSSDGHDKYYVNRLNEAQAIEKTMGEINGMMNRLSQITYDHSLMIDNISQNTDIALGNVERGAKEVKEILENVKGNRGLMLRIFFIIIVVSVVYILFFA